MRPDYVISFHCRLVPCSSHSLFFPWGPSWPVVFAQHPQEGSWAQPELFVDDFCGWEQILCHRLPEHPQSRGRGSHSTSPVPRDPHFHSPKLPTPFFVLFYFSACHFFYSTVTFHHFYQLGVDQHPPHASMREREGTVVQCNHIPWTIHPFENTSFREHIPRTTHPLKNTSLQEHII